MIQLVVFNILFLINSLRISYNVFCLFLFCMNECFACIYACALYVCLVSRGQRRALDTLELNFRQCEPPDVGPGNQT